jgi:hypothetical protein
MLLLCPYTIRCPDGSQSLSTFARHGWPKSASSECLLNYPTWQEKHRGRDTFDCRGCETLIYKMWRIKQEQKSCITQRRPGNPSYIFLSEMWIKPDCCGNRNITSKPFHIVEDLNVKGEFNVTYISTFYTVNNESSHLLKYNLALCVVRSIRWL